MKGLKGASRIDYRKPRDPAWAACNEFQARRGAWAAVVGDGEGSIGENLVRRERYTAGGRRAGTGYTDHGAVRACFD